MSTHNKILQVYNSRKYILEILYLHVGYDIKEYDGFSMNEIDAMMATDQLDMLLTNVNYYYKETIKRKIYIKYFIKGNLTDSSLRPIVEDLYQLSDTLTTDDCLLIIYDGEPSDSLLVHLDQLYKRDKIFVVVINIKRLQFNILNHMLVPKVDILTEAEKEALFVKYNITNPSQMPEISRYDPQALVICLRPGQVCKFTRKSPTTINSDYYRICV